MSFKPREYTNKVLEAVAEGLLDRDTFILACLNWMSESSVEQMCDANLLFEHEDEEEDEDDITGEHIDNYNWVGSRHHY